MFWVSQPTTSSFQRAAWRSHPTHLTFLTSLLLGILLFSLCFCNMTVGFSPPLPLCLTLPTLPWQRFWVFFIFSYMIRVNKCKTGLFFAVKTVFLCVPTCSKLKQTVHILVYYKKTSVCEQETRNIVSSDSNLHVLDEEGLVWLICVYRLLLYGVELNEIYFG